MGTVLDIGGGVAGGSNAVILAGGEADIVVSSSGIGEATAFLGVEGAFEGVTALILGARALVELAEEEIFGIGNV